MVITGAVLSTIAWYYREPVWAIGILMGFALIDMILFVVMPDVLVCYRCQSRYTGFDDAGPTGHFNLETAERYRQEIIRREQSRSTK